jgi:hypothetical protein
MHPVLRRLGLRHTKEEQTGTYTIRINDRSGKVTWKL